MKIYFGIYMRYLLVTALAFLSFSLPTHASMSSSKCSALHSDVDRLFLSNRHDGDLINDERSTLGLYESKLDKLNRKISYYRSKGNHSAADQLVGPYNSMLDKYNAMQHNFNSHVEKHNKSASRQRSKLRRYKTYCT